MQRNLIRESISVNLIWIQHSINLDPFLQVFFIEIDKQMFRSDNTWSV